MSVHPLLLLVGIFAVIGSDRGTALAEPIDLVAAGTQAGPAENRPELAKAISAFQRRDVEATLQWLRQARSEDSDLAPAEIMLASMYFSDEQPVKGREWLEQATVKHPEDPEPHLIFGDLAWRERRLSDAQVQYERGGQLTAGIVGSPGRKRNLKVRALAGLANVAEARGQHEVAHKWFTALLSVEPEHANAHFRLGNVLFQLGRAEEALEEFRSAERLNDTAPLPPLTLAELYQQAGDFDRAEHWIEMAIEESPDDARPELAMARWQLETYHAVDVAAEHVDRAAALDPQSTEVALLRGLIAWCREELDLAEKEFESLVLKDPDQVAARNYLAAVLAEQDDPGRRQRAWELVQMTASTQPRDRETIATLGWVAYHMGDFDRAQQQLRLAAGAPGVSRDATYYLARTQFRQGQIVAARETLSRALEADGLFVHRDQASDWQAEIGKPDDKN